MWEVVVNNSANNLVSADTGASGFVSALWTMADLAFRASQSALWGMGWQAENPD